MQINLFLKISYKQVVTFVDFLRILFTDCSGTVNCHIMSKSCMEVRLTELAMDLNTENIVGGLRMLLKLLLGLLANQICQRTVTCTQSQKNHEEIKNLFSLTIPGSNL